MKKLLSAFFVVLVFMALSNTAFTQQVPVKKSSEISNVRFGGSLETGGFRLVADANGKDWKLLSGEINKDIFDEEETSEYVGCTIDIDIESEKDSVEWNGLLYRRVPVRSVYGTVTLSDRMGQIKFALRGYFHIVQALSDAQLQFNFIDLETNVVTTRGYTSVHPESYLIVEGWHSEYKLRPRY